MKPREKNKPLIILGIDPGSISCGYGVIRAVHKSQTNFISQKTYPGSSFSNSESVYIASGRFIPSAGSPLHLRLKELFDAIVDIIREYSPDEVAVERVFFAKGIKSALTLGHARGAILLAAAHCGLPIFEYSALQVKKAIVGYGRAEKNQVQFMMSKILNLKFKLSSDSADALAIALCHTNTSQLCDTR